ncbi:MAG TPA: sensor domain-containing protein [Streptosporangiaceae bacterium]
MAAAGTGSRAAWRGPARAAVWSVVSARTWLAVIHLLVGLFLGTVAFTVVVTGAALGVALLVVALVGLPVLWGVLLLAGWFARAERARFALLLGERIPDPAAYRPLSAEGWWPRLRRYLAARTTWQHFGYALLRLPLSVLQFVIVLTVWPVALAMIALPTYYRALPRGSEFLGGTAPPGAWEVAGLTVGGVILLLLAPQVTRGLAVTDAMVARVLLGPPKTQLQARIGELERSRAAVVDSAEAERRRIERDLHDGAQQRLVALAMDLGRAKARFSDDPEAARAIVDQAHAEAKAALAELRNLVRGVHPPVLTDRGLDAALSGLAALSPVPVAVTVDVPARPPSSVEAIAYFVVAESLTNVAKHAHATEAAVSVVRRADTLSVVISDNGVGGADPRGQGLTGLADRVAGVDGRLSVHSPAGGGTVIEVELSCAS